MKEILVPINFASESANLIQYAASLNKRSGAHLTFFYVGTPSIWNRNRELIWRIGENEDAFLGTVKYGWLRNRVRQTMEKMAHLGIDYSIKLVTGSRVRRIVKEGRNGQYDLVILATHARPGLKSYLSSALASRIIGEVPVPVFVVPARSNFREIEHITYAVDLRDYDQEVIQQVKKIASLFDARLTIAHVNAEYDEREKYLRSLQQTITDTLDYPKVYYKFFDNADPFVGIKQFMVKNNTNLVAMINRRKFDWRDAFSGKSLTRKMAKDLQIPLLAFHKK